jgi:hypothetical protein
MSDDDDEDDFTKTVMADDPQMCVQSTTSSHDGWRTNGKIIFAIRKGHEKIAALEFLFEDARNEADAIQQGIVQLRSVVGALSKIVQRF